MLLESESCDPLLRDKDFKKPRDYCQRLLFMQKLIRRAEISQIVWGETQGRQEESPDIRHSALNLKVLRKQHKEIKIQPLTSRSMKRSASEIRDVKTAAPPGGLLFGT